MPTLDQYVTTSDLIDLITALWLGFIGACIGSFLNVVAYRMPLGMSVIWKSSHCPKCSHPIRAYDNVPVLGWLWLKGKCRDCSEPISPRYAIVESVMGCAFFLLAYTELFSGGANLPGGPISELTGAMENVWMPQWKLIGVFAYHGLLLSLLMSIALIDLDGQKMPRTLFWIGVAGVLTMLLLGVQPWTGISVNPSVETSKVHAIGLSLVGAACGIVAGVLVATLWRGRLEAADATTSTGPILVGRTGQPYSEAESLWAAFSLVGLFGGYQLACYAFIGTTAILVVAKTTMSKQRWQSSKLTLPCLGFVVAVILTSWKPLIGLLPI